MGVLSVIKLRQCSSLGLSQRVQSPYDEQHRVDLKRNARTSFMSQIASKFLFISPVPSNSIHAPRHAKGASIVLQLKTSLVGSDTIHSTSGTFNWKPHTKRKVPGLPAVRWGLRTSWAKSSVPQRWLTSSEGIKCCESKALGLESVSASWSKQKEPYV